MSHGEEVMRMNARTELQVRGLERRAAQFEHRARELEGEAIGFFRPSSSSFYGEMARAERYRAMAKRARVRAAQLRTNA